MSKINNTIDQPLKEIEDNVDQLKKDLEYIDLQLTEIENGNQSKEASSSWEEEPFTFISSNISSKLCNYFEPIFAEIAKDPSIIAPSNSHDELWESIHAKNHNKNDSNSHDELWESIHAKNHNKNDSNSHSEYFESFYANDDSFSAYANRYSNYNDDFCFI